MCRFDLYYYTCAGCYVSMDVDNGYHEDPMQPGSSTSNSSGSGSDNIAPPLERLIHTKWDDARITFKRPPPASLSY